jgi:hypothetical protein
MVHEYRAKLMRQIKRCNRPRHPAGGPPLTHRGGSSDRRTNQPDSPLVTAVGETFHVNPLAIFQV